MSEKLKTHPLPEVKTPVDSNIEHSDRSTVSKLISYVRCEVLSMCEKADAADAASRLRSSIEGSAKGHRVKVDLSTIADESHRKIIRTGIIRKLLFGNNPDIIKTKGVHYSPADEKLYPVCLSNETARKGATCQKLLATPKDAILLDGVVEVNFARNLKEMWEEKITNYGNSNPEIAKFYDARVRPIVEGQYRLEPYSRQAYERDVAKAMNQVNAASDMKLGLSKYGLEPGTVRANLAKKLITSMTPADFVAIGLTEIMDSKNTKFNLKVLDAVLAKGGWEYFSLIPALADAHVSYGPYQHTKMSVGKDGWATIPDDRFTGGKILKTRDIMKLPREDQHSAAYLMALHNTALLMRSLSVERVAPTGKKKKGAKIPETDFAQEFHSLIAQKNQTASDVYFQFIAAAHNNPTKAVEGMNRWLREYVASGRTKLGKELKIHVSKSSPTARNNADKQKSNHVEVKRDQKEFQKRNPTKKISGAGPDIIAMK